MLVSPPTYRTAQIKTSMRGLMSAAALLAALAAPSISHAEQYDLDISRTAEVGQRFLVEGEAYQNNEMKQIIEGQQPTEQNSSTEINLTGEIEYLAVDDDGGVTQLALSVAHYDIEINSEGVGLDTDQRILATVNDEGVDYTYESSATLPDGAALMLDELLGDLLTVPGVEADNEGDGIVQMIGLDEPRTSGEHWQADALALLNMMNDGSSNGMQINHSGDPAENDVHFVEINRNVFGEDTAVLAFGITFEGFNFGGNEFPEFMAFEQSEFAIAGSVWSPLDPASGQRTLTFSVDMAFRVAGTVPEENIELALEVQVEGGRSLTLRNIDG